MLARVEDRREVTAQEAAELIGRDAYWINNTLKRAGAIMSSGFDESQGKARPMTKANLVELCFVASFTAAGVKLSDAVAYAAMYLRHYRARSVREWIFFSIGSGAKSATGTDDLSAAALAQLATKSNPPGLVVIQAGEIVRRIDRFFEEGASD